jgi:pyridoxal phosphate enzyme (YggS family)
MAGPAPFARFPCNQDQDMAHSAVTQLNDVLSGIREAEAAHDRAAGSVCLVAVSKTFEAEDIRPVLEAGQRVFGENRVQEAMGKWPQLRTEYPGIELHLIGPLQSNKAKEAVATFDVIHTIDREKIARALKGEMTAQGRDLPCFIQVNTGEEPQKAGIAPKETDEFIRLCREEIGLNVIGLMCIPPVDEAPGPHFALLEKIARRNGLVQLSMGMSSDFEIAVSFGATHVRVGSAIFGGRG